MEWLTRSLNVIRTVGLVQLLASRALQQGVLREIEPRYDINFA